MNLVVQGLRSARLMLVWAALLANSALAEPPAAPIEAHLSTRQESANSGSGVVVDVRLTNVSNVPLSIAAEFSLPSSPYTFRAFLAGRQVSSALDEKARPADELEEFLASISSNRSVTLQPGQSEQISYKISQHIDFSQPGQYKLQFITKLASTWIYHRDLKRTRLESNIVTIVVLPRP